jgi:hypothetical protein
MSSVSVVETLLARAVVSTAEEVMPCLDEFYLMFRDKSLDRIQLVLGKATGLGFLNWLEPKLRNLTVVFDVHVRRLTSIATGEEESMLPDKLDRWHQLYSHARPYSNANYSRRATYPSR